MPTYDYVCDACHHQVEIFHSIKDEPKRKCPKCGRQKLRRLIGPGAAIVFKGSGFYQTDYRSESYKKAAAAEKSAATGGDTKKTEGKSAAKSETKGDAKGKEKKAKE
jgi:putative FmdB family regulatory protein